jgi:V-type H+-transporting ATPase subunit H
MMLATDLEVLLRILHENFKELTTWEVYQAELDSGQLKWGILHTEKFFRENARRMEGSSGDFLPVRRLVQLIAKNAYNDDDEDVAAIACFDLGEFVRHYPNGRSIAKRLGAKEVVMQLMDHENPEVQRHALQCVSKILVQNWQATS